MRPDSGIWLSACGSEEVGSIDFFLSFFPQLSIDALSFRGGSHLPQKHVAFSRSPLASLWRTYDRSSRPLLPRTDPGNSRPLPAVQLNSRARRVIIGIFMVEKTNTFNTGKSPRVV